MSRSFRHSDAFAEKREAFEVRRQARDARAREFAALGYDDAEAFADLPIYSRRAREAARRAWRD